MRFSEQYKFIPCLNDGDLNAGATLDTDSICMKGMSHICFIVSMQTHAVADVTLTAHCGKTNAAISSTIYFDYRWGSAAQAAATCDVLAAAGSKVNTLVIAHATSDNKMLLVEIPAEYLDRTNDEEWIQLRLTCGTATGNVSVTAIAVPRYPQQTIPTAIA